MATESLKQWLAGRRVGSLRLECTRSGGFAAQVDTASLASPTFGDLPYEIRVAILAYLDPISLCAASAVSRAWRAASNDVFLWRRVLESDMALWPYITHATLPGHHQRHIAPKQSYLANSPLTRRGLFSEARIEAAARSTRLRQRIAVFGLGLEHSAHTLVDDMMHAAHSPFRVIGMSAGTEGIGGGITLKHNKGFELDMIVLFQKTAAERRQANDQEHGRLAQGLSPAARAVCAGVHSYVFVVDAGRMADENEMLEQPHTQRALHELQMLLHPEWARRQGPLLILACHGVSDPEADAPVKPMGCVQVAETLHLSSLAPRPWRVEMMDMRAFDQPLTRGFQWLAARAV